MPRWILTLAGAKLGAGFLAAVLLALLPGVARAAEPPAEKSANVSWITTLDELQAISARSSSAGRGTTWR